MDSVQIEIERRWKLYNSFEDKTKITAGELREKSIYGSAAGVWTHKGFTKDILPEVDAFAVSILHTGVDYEDSADEFGIDYSYPNTGRAGVADSNEINALKSCLQYGIPIFIIFKRGKFREIKMGAIQGFDDKNELFFISYIDNEVEDIPTLSPQQDNSEFKLHQADEEASYSKTKQRKNQSKFRMQVLSRYGIECAACKISHIELIQAAHIVDKKHKGSDDPRNGIPLCLNHHSAFDKGLFKIDPNDLAFVFPDERYTAESLQLEREKLNEAKPLPHVDAIQWAFDNK